MAYNCKNKNITLKKRTFFVALITILLTLTSSNAQVTTSKELSSVKIFENLKDSFQQISNQDRGRILGSLVEYVLQATTTTYASEIDYFFYLLNKFLEGFKATVFAPNAMKCSAKAQLMANDYNQTYLNYLDPVNPNDISAYVFNATRVISGTTADAEGECYTTAWNVYQYIIMRKAQFPSFVDFLSAFLQNLVGNILTFNNLYQNIVNANTAGKLGDVYFYLGKLCYLILYFDPIEEGTLDSSPEHTINSILQQLSILSNGLDQDENDFSFNYHKLGMQQVKSTFSTSDLILGIVVDFPAAFMESAVGSASPNSTICTGNLSVMNSSAYYLYTQAQLELYEYMGTTIKSMLQAVNPIGYACYNTIFEFYQIVLDYMVTVTDINKLFYNVVHNLGNIYDDTTVLISIFRTKEFYLQRQYYEEMGYYFGDIVHQIGYKPEDYEPYTPPKYF